MKMIEGAKAVFCLPITEEEAEKREDEGEIIYWNEIDGKEIPFGAIAYGRDVEAGKEVQAEIDFSEVMTWQGKNYDPGKYRITLSAESFGEGEIVEFEDEEEGMDGLLFVPLEIPDKGGSDG